MFKWLGLSLPKTFSGEDEFHPPQVLEINPSFHGMSVSLSIHSSISFVCFMQTTKQLTPKTNFSHKKQKTKNKKKLPHFSSWQLITTHNSPVGQDGICRGATTVEPNKENESLDPWALPSPRLSSPDIGQLYTVYVGTVGAHDQHWLWHIDQLSLWAGGEHGGAVWYFARNGRKFIKFFITQWTTTKSTTTTTTAAAAVGVWERATEVVGTKTKNERWDSTFTIDHWCIDIEKNLSVIIIFIIDNNTIITIITIISWW